MIWLSTTPTVVLLGHHNLWSVYRHDWWHMIYHYVLAYDFSTAQHIHHVPYLHLARRMRKKIHASESGSESVSKWHRLSFYLFCVMVYGYACFISVQTAWNNRWLVDWQWVTVAWLASGQVSDGRTCSNIAHRTRSDPNQNHIPNWPQPTITNPKHNL